MPGQILSDDEFLGADGGVAPAAPAAAAPAVMTDDQFLNAPPPPPPSLLSRIGSGLKTVETGMGLVGTGANDTLATIAGAPVDLLTGAINKAPGLAHYLSGGAIPDTSGPLISNPVGGSQSLREALTGALGRTEPKTPVERVLYGAGGAAMSVPLMGMLPLPAAASEFATPATGADLARSATIAAGSGAGGSAAKDVAAKATDNPWLQAGADVLGGTAGALATGGALAVPRIASQLVRPLTSGGQQTIAGRLLNQAAGGAEMPGATANLVSDLAAEPQPAGITPTLGDITGNRGLQVVQRAVEAGSPEAAGQGHNIATQNNQAIRQAFDDIGQPGDRTPEQISQTAAQRLEAIRADQQQQASGAFQAVDPGKQAMVPTAQLQDRYDDYVTGLTAARRRFVPDSYGKLLEGYEPEEPLQELQDFASTLKTEARQAGSGASPDYNRANVLSGLHDALFPEGGPEGLLQPAQGDIGDALRAARDQWRNYAQTYTEPTAVKSVLQAGGGTPDTAAFDKLLGSGQGQTERVGQFLSAAQGDPELLQHARDWFSAKMLAAGETAGQDQQGSQLLNGNQLRKFTDANQPLINSDIFDDTHRQAIGDIVDAANTVQRTARAGAPGGSDTYRNLQTGNYLREFGMSPVASTIARAPSLAGAGVGASLGAAVGGPYGAAIGVPIGTSLGHALSYAGPQRNVLGLVNQAVHDPALAGRLMTRAATRPPAPSGFTLRDLLAGAAGTAFAPP